MMKVTNLPEVIYQEILSWLNKRDQVSFAMVNVMISRQLLKSVRGLLMMTSWGRPLKEKFRLYLTSEKHQNLITDPYHQLRICIPENMDFEAECFEATNITCSSLSTTVNQLTKSLIPRVKKVQRLMLGSYGTSSINELTDSELQIIGDWINNSNIRLKHLSIDNYDITNLPLIENLESLSITNAKRFPLSGLHISSYYNHLRYLKLSSDSIEDVSSLDRIYDLDLSFCSGIRDISCLNHNYRITITDCENILDYSNCFRYSKIIDISTNPGYQLTMKSYDLSSALEAREIYFWGGESTEPLILPQSSSLRYVQADTLRGYFMLPSKHNIREITVRDCPRFSFLVKFDNISSIKLVELNISSLRGLGSRNRVVEVDSCTYIKDFSMLKHCDKVTIRNCEGFQDFDQIRGVKDFIFHPVDVNNLPKNMEGVTCLVLIKAPQDLLSLKVPSTLIKLVIDSKDVLLIHQLPSLFASLPPHVEKIAVSVKEKDFLPMLANSELSFPDFIIESIELIELSKGFSTKSGIQFLRKIH